jgi:hypothetical protein
MKAMAEANELLASADRLPPLQAVAKRASAAAKKQFAAQQFQRAIRVTHKMIKAVCNALGAMARQEAEREGCSGERNGIAFVVAPFEADAQLVWLARQRHVDVIITEDSDIPVFLMAVGASAKVWFKLDVAGSEGATETALQLCVSPTCIQEWGASAAAAAAAAAASSAAASAAFASVSPAASASEGTGGGVNPDPMSLSMRETKKRKKGNAGVSLLRNLALWEFSPSMFVQVCVRRLYFVQTCRPYPSFCSPSLSADGDRSRVRLHGFIEGGWFEDGCEADTRYERGARGGTYVESCCCFRRLQAVDAQEYKEEEREKEREGEEFCCGEWND